MTELVLTGSQEEETLSGADEDIYRYIANNKDECYDDVLAYDDRWEVFYHLSEMRTSILNWYDFEEESSVLEIGGGFGAITGMLCRRAGSVIAVEKSLYKAKAISIRYRSRDNLSVYAGEAGRVEFPHRFDYVVITGSACGGSGGVPPEIQLKQYVNLAEALWLKDSGKLLLALDNRNGAKYQCGYPRPVTGGINENGVEAMLTREQLHRLLSEYGFVCQKFYYPFPDYRLAQEIYTDIILPEGSIKDRMLTYCVMPGFLYKDEYQFYSPKIATGDIRNICNSYLAECSRTKLVSDADYIAVSTDRGREHSFFTVIGRERVRKSAVYEEGEKNLSKSYDNILQIERAGLKIVPHIYHQGRLSMPIVRGPKLIDLLWTLAVENREKFVQAIDKLYECIVKSSGSTEKAGRVFLRQGYIDLIPLNCFVEKGQYYFFDQEFCVPECPVDYIMFRALRYTYLTYPELETYIGIEEMKERYQLKNSWQNSLHREDEFIWENRQHRVNHGFYRWIENAKISHPVIDIPEVCGVYLAEDFDALEKNQENCWAWAVGKYAGIYIRNYTDQEIRIGLKFSLGPPPGRQEQSVIICRDDLETEVSVPAVFEYEEAVPANEICYLRFCTAGALSRCENGDPRSFAFQMLDPEIRLI